MKALPKKRPRARFFIRKSQSANKIYVIGRLGGRPYRKNCGRVFAGWGQHFQTGGHSFPLYGPILSRSITFISFFLAVNLLTSEFGYVTFSLNPLTRCLQPFVKSLTSDRASNSDTRQRKIISVNRCESPEIRLFYRKLSSRERGNSLSVFPAQKFSQIQ